MARKKSISPENPIILIIDKPKGYVCSKVSDSHPTVYELIPEKYKNLTPPLNPVGRLDADTTGLLLFTNDGKLNHQLTSPESHVSKTYLVDIRDRVDEKTQQIYTRRCKEGLVLPAEKKAPEQFVSNQIIEWISPSQCTITICEGKFHQVRRTFLSLGNEVKELRRLSFGEYKI